MTTKSAEEEEKEFLNKNSLKVLGEKAVNTSLGYSKKELRQEKKRRKSFKKKLIKYIKKNYKTTDFFSIIEVLDLIVCDFYDYFDTGVNCYQVDASRIPIAEQLLEIKRDLELVEEVELFGEVTQTISTEDASKIESNALKHLFNIFGEHIREWWD